VADKRTEREQREEEADAALASAGAAAAPAAGEQPDEHLGMHPGEQGHRQEHGHEDVPDEPQPEEGAPVEGEVPAGEEAAAGEPTVHAEAAPAALARRAYSKAFGRRMVQLQDDVDLEVWPELIDWMNDQLLARGIDVPPPPDVP
jgi:hypothetical protein